MSYVIFKTDGAVLTTIADGTINTTSTPLGLPGRLYAGYGQVFDTNVVHLLENFANIAPPQNALAGQLWFNTTDSILYICPSDNETNPSNWIPITSTIPGANTQFGNIEANNLNLTNTLTANLVDTDYLTVNIQANIANANVTGTANIANLITTDVSASNVSATRLSGSLTTAAQPNITSIGTLTSLGVNGTVTAAAFTANTGIFTGNGSGLTALTGANVTGTVPSATAATTAGTVTTAAQSNITSVGTLTGLGVNGNIAAANITANTGIFSGNGAGLTNLPGANVIGTVASATSANTAGTVTTAAQPNITSTGTLTGIFVSGNARFTGANVSLGSNANVRITGGSSGEVLTTDGSGNLSWVPTGTSTTAQTVTHNAQPNITSVGTMSFLIVSGNINSGNVIGTHFGSGAGLSNIPGGNVTGSVANATFATTAGTVTSIPSGTRMLFAQTSAPTGWTKQTSNDNAALRVVSGSAGSGGSVNFTSAFTSQAVSGSVSGSIGGTALSTGQMPAHSHTISDPGHLHTISDPGHNHNVNDPGHAHNYTQYVLKVRGDDNNDVLASSTTFQNSTSAATTGISIDNASTGISINRASTGISAGTTGSGSTHTHSFSGNFSGTAINLAVKYVDVIIAQKD